VRSGTAPHALKIKPRAWKTDTGPNAGHLRIAILALSESDGA
jgi:hypothetical protein